jgi:hypothetical protein
MQATALVILAVIMIVLFGIIFRSIGSIDEQIEPLACGKIVNIRATGSFNRYDIELTFDDGSILLVKYSFCRSNNLRVGDKVNVYDSSIYGMCCRRF